MSISIQEISDISESFSQCGYWILTAPWRNAKNCVFPDQAPVHEAVDIEAEMINSLAGSRFIYDPGFDPELVEHNSSGSRIASLVAGSLCAAVGVVSVTPGTALWLLGKSVHRALKPFSTSSKGTHPVVHL